MKIDNRISAAVIIATLIAVAYIFYYQSYPFDESLLDQRNNAAFNVGKAEQGESLKNLVAKPAGGYEENMQQNQLSVQAKKIVGRYWVRVSCEDPIVKCKDGSADYIVTLLDTGDVRRTIVYLGSVAPIKERQYRKDIWKYNEANQEVVIHLVEGAKFYLDVNQAQNLVINIEKTLADSAENQAFFSQRNLPLENYELKRDNHN